MSQFRLVAYQDAWPSQFAAVAAELRELFGANRATLEHIGSTAVPGLCAKPVLDVLAGVDNLVHAEEVRHALALLGFVYRPEHEVQLPDRRYFVRAEASTPRVHLHCVLRGGPLWQQHLLFRQVLRQDPDVRARYAALKQRLATAHADNKAAYTEAKAPFIRKVLAAAETLRARPRLDGVPSWI